MFKNGSELQGVTLYQNMYFEFYLDLNAPLGYTVKYVFCDRLTPYVIYYMYNDVS